MESLLCHFGPQTNFLSNFSQNDCDAPCATDSWDNNENSLSHYDGRPIQLHNFYMALSISDNMYCI